jgi:predicted dehydrogenase
MNHDNLLTSASGISRRSFLRTTGYGLGAAAFATSGLSSVWARGSEKKLGIALVGLGNYSTNQLQPAFKDAKNFRLAGIVTGTPAKAKTWSEKHSLPERSVYNYENFDTIADNPDIDAVYIALPNSMHAEYTIRAAKAGKHVICEKPMAISVKEAESMIAACKAAGVSLSIGYRMHFEPHTQEIMRLTRDKVYGDVVFVQTGFGFRIGDPTQWRLRKALAGGGAMMDVGIYCIQGTRYSTGMEPIAVSAREFKTDPVKFSEVDETISWQMEFPNGVAANCTTSYGFRFEELHVGTTGGWYNLSPAYSYGPIIGKTHLGPMNIGHTHHQTLQLEAMSQHILAGTTHSATGEEGLRDMKIIEAIYQSIAKGGKRVKLG